jgi:hypothetical protein
MRTVGQGREHRVGFFDCGLQRCRVRRRQISGDDPYLSGQPVGITYDCCDVMARGDGLLEDLPTDTAGRRKDSELHLLLLG